MARLQAVGDGFDPFKLEGGKDDYSLDRFFPQSRNKHDHSIKMTVYTKPDVAARINFFVASEDFPDINSQQDFIRDAEIHRLHYLENHYEVPGLSKWLKMQRRIAVREETDRFLAAMKEEYDALVLSIETARAAEDGVRLREIIEHYEEALDDFDEPYYTKFRTLLRKHKL